MSHQPATQSICANCSAPLDPQFRYCPQCSQKINLHRLTLHDIIHDAIHYFTHADKGILGLMKDLIVSTGKVAREYVTGKRKKYFPPLNFFLIAGTLYVLAMSIANPPVKYNAYEEAVKAIPKLAQAPQHVKDYVTRLFERQHKAETIITKYSNSVAMLAVPLVCLIYWLFYIKGRYNYTEHLIANLYISGFQNIFYSLIFVPIVLLLGIRQSKPNTLALVVVLLYLAFQLAYASVFYYRFINKGTQASAWKAAGVTVLATVVWIALFGGAIFLYIMNGFWGLLD